MLYIFGGLPGVGKTTLAKRLAKALSAVYLRIDSIEQSMKNHGIGNIYDEAYQVASSLAIENLRLGMTVITDSTNPVIESRQLWRSTAELAEKNYVEIEVICSDVDEHKQRVETRISDIPELNLPTWQQVKGREYEPWASTRIVIDTSGKCPEQCITELLAIIDDKDAKR